MAMFIRRRPLLRAGMLAGGAYMAHEAGERSVQRQYAEADQDQRLADLEAEKQVAAAPPPPAPVPPPVAAETGLVAELTKLKGLLDAGALTQDEFDSAKRKLLSS
jgi:putative oligomerization/nucleic acid binding protein